MRISDLDRDHSQIFIDSVLPDTAFLCERMEKVLFEALEAPAGGRVLDVAAGLGQETRVLAERGFLATGAEPSKLLTDLKQLLERERGLPDMGSSQTQVRAWGESLPFSTGTFDACFCKGSLDHFDDPVACVREMARVTRPNGRVAFAIANMEALALKLMRNRDTNRAARHAARRERHLARRHWDAPADHITRYDPELMREHLSRYLQIEVWSGVSMLWGLPGWAGLLQRLPQDYADRCLRVADLGGRMLPQLADVLIIAGRPRLGTHD